VTIQKIRLLTHKYPTFKKLLYPAIVIRRFFSKRNSATRKIYEHLCELLVEDPVIKVDEFEGIFTVDSRSDLFKRLLLHKAYEPSLVKLALKYLNKDRDVIDIGANIGFYTVLFAKNLNSGKVLSIEPTKNAFQRLLKNIKLNQVEDKVILFEGAVLNYIGTTKIKIVEGKEEYSTLGSLSHPSISKKRYILQEVKTKTIDELVDQYSLDPGFMKVDVEGMEHLVFDGSKDVLKTKRPVILSELSDYLLKKNGSSAIKVIDFLKSLDYIIVDAETPEIDPQVKEFTNILCIPSELGVQDSKK